MNPYDFVNAIGYTKHDLMEDPLCERDYIPFVVNRALSYNMDCIMFANEMNQRPLLDRKLQFQYLLNTVRSRRRSANKWAKPIHMEDVEVLQRIYGFSKKVALQSLSLLNEHQLAILRERADLGGTKKSK